MGTARSEGEDEFALSDLFAQILARKWWMLTILLLGGLAGAFIGQLAPNMFRADAVVQIERRSGSVSLPAELVGTLLSGAEGTSGPLATEIHIIRSRLILRPVVDALSLDLRVDPVKAPVIGEALARRNLPFIGDFLPERFIRAGEYLQVARLDLPADLDQVDLHLEVLAAGRVAVTLPDGARIEADSDAPIALPGGGTLEIAALQAPPGREFRVRRIAPRVAIQAVARGLEIVERGSSGIVDFSFSGPDPDQATRIINTVVETYQDHNLGRRSAQIDQSIAFIEEQLPELRAEYRAASEALAEYRRNQDSRELSLTTQQLLNQTVELETEIENLEFRREQLLLRLTSNHPDYLALVAEEDRLRARLEDLRALMGEVPEAEQELARLTQQVDRARQLELQLTNRVEQLRILRASTIGNIFVLEPAEFGRQVGPDRRTPIILGATLAFLLGALGVFGVNALRRGIEDAREIEDLGLSLYATV
ncbi:Wzz/FepE/Etk N-terminal domain-containing protein, partial [Alkalilacustris brevis]|uniref:Wzz/FepE/Etk N-terminal domain-containing protein n=1 Tax=Alkalilacustris brevis TaxID=2026338 RepID=UPI001EE4D135